MSIPQPKETTPELEASTNVPEHTPQLDGSSLPQPVEGPVLREWWLLRLVGRLFVGLCSLILSPFREASIRLPEDDQAPVPIEDDEDEEDVQEASRRPESVLRSSTCVVLQSFTVMLVLRAGERSVPHHVKHSLQSSRISIIPYPAKPNLFAFTDLLDVAPEPVHVMIRSYAQFTFASPPPFRFLLPPGEIPENLA